MDEEESIEDFDEADAFMDALFKAAGKPVKRVNNPDGYDELYKKPFKFILSETGGHKTMFFDMKDKQKVVSFFKKSVK